VNKHTTDDIDANAFEIIWCDTTDNTISVTLPDSPNDYDIITIVDEKYTAENNNINVARNGNNIDNKDEDLSIDINGSYITLKFYSNNWYII
jgi:hypothetical protein